MQVGCNGHRMGRLMAVMTLTCRRCQRKTDFQDMWLHWTRWGSLSSVWENRGRSLDEPWRGSRAHPDHDNDTDAQSKGRVECLCLSCPLEITVMWLKEVGRARQAQYTDRKKERETGYDVGMESPLTRILKCQRKYRNGGAFIWISNWEDFRKQETWSCFDGCQTWEKNENSQRK